MLNYKQIWHGIKPTRWLIKFNLTIFISKKSFDLGGELVTLVKFTNNRVILSVNFNLIVNLFTSGLIRSSPPRHLL